MNSFETDNFALKGEDLSIDSFRVLEMMSSSSAAQNKSQKALKSLTEKAGSTS
jgi:hypothetical protein